MREPTTMTIAIHLSSQLMAQALCQLLQKSGYTVVTDGGPPTKGSIPNILLVDIHTLSHALVMRYPDARVLLIDTGLGSEELTSALLSYRVHGVLSPHAELHLFKKALTAINEGQIWIDNGSVKALFHDARDVSQEGNSNHITGRQQEIIECVCQGLSNNEIARKLTLSPHTVKAHLNTIFKKCNVTSRSKLMTLSMHSRQAASA
jgi:DNA-binding NarL/FixJ family response regulator